MKRIISYLLLIVAVMFLLPLAAAKLAPADAGMALCFILFFAVNPVFSIVMGILSGINTRRLWYMPIVSAVVFLLSTWLLFDIGEMAFVIYAAVYLTVGMLALFITYLVNRNKRIA